MSKKESKKCIFKKPMVRRMFVSIFLGVVFGFLCSYLAYSGDNSPLRDNFWGSAMMWSIVFNRTLIGAIIAFAGFIVIHPILGVRMYPSVRGALLGAIVSVDIVFGPFISHMQNANFIAYSTIIAGAVYGMIIDMVATRLGGEGEDLIKDVI